MVDKAAGKAALVLWRLLQGASVLLLAAVLATLVVSVLFPGTPSHNQAAVEAVASAPIHPPIGDAAGAGLPASGGPARASVMTPVPASPTATTSPTSTAIPPTITPVVPSLPQAGHSPARGDMEAALGLASQARWQRARSTPTPTPSPTLPAPAPTPTLPPPPTVVASGPPTRIVAPTIGLDARVVTVKWKKTNENGHEVLSWTVPKNDAGWHFTSALPGQPGNTVLTGHRNIYAEVFRYIPDLKPGDPITLYAGDQAFVYYVEEQHIVQEVGVPDSVRQENARWIAHTDDTRLTLITCAPYGPPGNTHRVIVVARP